MGDFEGFYRALIGLLRYSRLYIERVCFCSCLIKFLLLCFEIGMMMEDDIPFRKLSLQEYPHRKYVLKSVNRSPVMPGSPVIPVRRTAFSSPVPVNVQYEYEYVPTSPSDGVVRKYSLEEYPVIEKQDQYSPTQSYFVEVPSSSMSPTYRPVQQVQPYYSVQGQQPVIQGNQHQAHLTPWQNMSNQPSQIQSQQQVQQIQLVRPIQQIQQGMVQQIQQGMVQQMQPGVVQQMQPGVEYIEYQPRRPGSLQSYIPVTTHQQQQQHHSYPPEYIHGLSDIQEIKSPDIKKHVTFESPESKENDGINKKIREPATTDDIDSMYEPYVGLKKAPAAIRKKNMREKKEGLKGERFEEKKIVSHDEDVKESEVKKVEKHDIGKIGRFNVQKVDVSKKVVIKENDVNEDHSHKERRPRRHTVHCSPVDTLVDEQRRRKSAMCAMTACNIP